MEDILINIDSKYRDINIYPNENKFRINFDDNYKNITSAKLVSIELNHNVQFFNYNNINSLKNNNYFTLHIPNKLNDIDGTKIMILNGYTRTIDAVKNNINDQVTIFNNSFNTNEKYFYIFYLMSPVTSLNLSVGWYSIYGLYNIIKASNIFNINFNLQIYDTRFPDNIRIDTIILSSNLNTLKNDLYNIYINDTINFIPNISGTGILDLLFNTYGIIYSINTNASSSNSKIFNLIFNYDTSSLLTNFSNSLGNIYTINSNSNIWNQINQTIFNTISFQIDFFNISLQNNNKLNYPSLGYLLGFRPLLNDFSLTSNYSSENNITEIISQYPFNLNDNLYLFLKINDWGHINFLNSHFFAKILFTSCLSSNKIDEYVNPEYKFRQPINFQKLDIELIDYLGNIIDLNGRDFSFTIKLTQVLNTEEKCKIERRNLFFLENK